jgi:hypothetical protein
VSRDPIHSVRQEARRLDAIDLALRKKLGLDAEFIEEPPLQKPTSSQWVTQYERTHARVEFQPTAHEPAKGGISRGNQSARGRIERSIWPSGALHPCTARTAVAKQRSTWHRVQHVAS